MKAIAALVLTLVAAAPAGAKSYDIDAAHSSVTFKIRHLVTKVQGRFDKVSGSVDYEKGKVASWKTEVEIDPASINTGVAGRDGHLKSGDFFDVEKCPKMSFKSTKATETTLTGDLTMHCVTKSVTLKLEIGGEAGGKFGAVATGKINRKDWGLNWNKAIEAGSLMVGEDVEMELDVEGAPKK